MQKKTIGVSRIQTRIVGVEGTRADHVTTPTSPNLIFLFQNFFVNERPDDQIVIDEHSDHEEKKPDWLKGEIQKLL